MTASGRPVHTTRPPCTATAAVTDLLAKVRIVFERLVAIEFAAPWEKRDDACVDC